jgi:hypothetical protein
MVGCAGDDGAASESESSATSGSTGGSTAEVSTGMTDGTGTTGTTADSTTTGSTSDETSTTADTDATTTSTTGDDGIAPDFGLLDVNESSASFDEVVSPRDYLEKVSGWYFAHAT